MSRLPQHVARQELYTSSILLVARVRSHGLRNVQNRSDVAKMG